MSGRRATLRGFEALATSSFVGLGLPDGMIGTAWPVLHASLGVPIADLGLVLLAVTAGSVTTLAVTGRLRRRLGIATLLALATATAAAGALGIALAPRFGILLAAAVPLGAGLGLVDGGLNTEVGVSARLRLLNLLHGCYGIGTAIGPLAVTAAVLAGSWRPAYGGLAAAELALALGWWLSRHRPAATVVEGVTGAAADRAVGPARAPAGGGERGGGAAGRRVATSVSAGMVVFFLYTGLEVAAGQWEATFCRLQLRFSASAAGVAVFGYWAALTLVRLGLGLGALRRQPAPRRLVAGGLAAAAVGSALVWWRPVPAVAVAGFLVIGASLAGVFPALVLLTPGRLGPRRAEHAIGWQVGAAAVGGSGISALIGLAIGSAGIGVLGTALTTLACCLLAANAVLGRLDPLADDLADPTR